MARFLSRLLLWMLLAALIAAIGRAVWAGFAIVRAGESLSSVPVQALIVDVMELHTAAAWGAAAGFLIAVFVPLPRLLRSAIDRLFGRAERARIADRWLEENQKRGLDFVVVEGDEEPTVENVITARGGLFRYRVMAFRHLTHAERQEIVTEALKRGLLSEPEPGGTATLMTSIGRET